MSSTKVETKQTNKEVTKNGAFTRVVPTGEPNPRRFVYMHIYHTTKVSIVTYGTITDIAIGQNFSYTKNLCY